VSETSASLLDRLRLQPDAGAWQRLVDLYTPLIQGWLRRHGVPPQDADDVVQEVLTVVVRRLPDFRRQPRTGAFRRWLRTITVNRLRKFWRARRTRPAGTADFDKVLDRLEDPHSDLSRLWDEEHDRHVVRRLLELLESDFEPATWSAFRLLVLEGRPTAEVAAALGVTPNAVRIAKSRVLRRFRQEVEGLVD
jgi:RNA polymerase sigma-70 factor, ECF subfamily